MVGALGECEGTWCAESALQRPFPEYCADDCSPLMQIVSYDVDVSGLAAITGCTSFDLAWAIGTPGPGPLSCTSNLQAHSNRGKIAIGNFCGVPAACANIYILGRLACSDCCPADDSSGPCCDVLWCCRLMSLLFFSLSDITEPCTGAPVCGDGTVDTGEECDDGNTADGDGCSATRMVARPLGQNVHAVLIMIQRSRGR